MKPQLSLNLAALPFLPSLIQTSGSLKEFLEAAAIGAVRSAEGWSQESGKPGTGEQS